MTLRRGIARVLLAGMLSSPAAAAQIPSLPDAAASEPVGAPLSPASARGTIRLASGRRLTYRATWSEMILRAADGTADATISYTAYSVDNPAPARPVVVLFNGGPGASSSPLHVRAFGPRLLRDADTAGPAAMIDNPDTLLDVADLIFVDPVGTGFSRPLRSGGGQPYWRVDGDADAAMRLIREWLVTNRREGAPLFVVGESYGAYRLGAMAPALAALDVAGAILVSPALDFGDAADQRAIEALPTMALAAWHHHRGGLAANRSDAVAVWNAARRFAQTEYAAALQAGTALDPARRSRIAARVAAVTGLTVSTIVDTGLRPDTQRFVETLMPGAIIGRLDVRVSRVAATQPPSVTTRPAAANDPALGLGAGNVIVSRPIAAYLRDEIGVRTERDYRSLTLDVNFAWDWNRPDPRPGAGWSVVPAIAALMRARPSMRLLAIGGLYDLATPWAGTIHALTRGDLPPDRVTMLALPAGHGPFDTPATRASAAATLRSFIVGPAATATR